MEGNIKIYASIFLLLFTIIHVFVPGAHSLGVSIPLYFSVEDDYNTPTNAIANIINTELNPSESNYPNTVRFHLYTKERRRDSVEIIMGDADSLKLGQFDPKKHTILITHGWLNDYKSPVCFYLRDAYLDQHDYNIILIDWGELARDGIYVVAPRVLHIAKYVAKMIDFLISQGMNANTTTIVGHSFGGHVAGLSSYYAKQKLNRVIAMDPAGPYFHNKGTGTRLSRDDGNYVQVIHTTLIFGLTEPLGHADFFVNGGIDQPGCWFPVVCGHLRSYEYFRESISSKGFVARKCDSYSKYLLGLCNSNQAVYMGGVEPDHNAYGVYYLTTNPKPPFAKF